MHGGCSAGWAWGFVGSVLAPWVVVLGVLLEVSSSLVAVACALPGVVPACCVCLVRRCGCQEPVPWVWAVRGVA